MSLVVRSRRVVTPDGVRPAAIHVARRHDRARRAMGRRGVPMPRDVGELAILPGIVDTHVHVNEPGRTEWEGFATATRAAAVGGVTTLVDMPLNCIPPTTTREAFAAKRAAARGQVRGRRRASGAASCRATPASSRRLVDAGVRGFKCFLVDSGVDEFGWVGEADLRAGDADPRDAGVAAARARRARRARSTPRDGATLAPPIRAATRPTSRRARRRPRTQAIALRHAPVPRDARARRTSSISRRRARSPSCAPRAREGLPLSAETCPHYLHFAAEDDPRRRDAVQVRAADPRARRTARRCGARSPRACSISSSPITRRARPRSRRSRPATSCARGAASPSLQLALPVVWTEAQRARPLARRPRALDVRRARRGSPGSTGEGRDRAGPRRRPRRVVADAEPRRRRRRACSIATSSRPTLGETLRGVVHATYRARRSVYVGAHGGRADRRLDARGAADYERLLSSCRRSREPSASAAPAIACNDEFFAEKENLLKRARRRIGASKSTPIAASGWTAGRPRSPAAGVAPGRDSDSTTGASCGSACRA